MEMINANNPKNIINVKLTKEEIKGQVFSKYQRVNIHPKPKNKRIGK